MSSEKSRNWTPEEVTRLRQTVADYATVQELAETFGRTVSAIYQKLSQLGLKTKRRPETEPHEWGGAHEIKPRVEVVREAGPLPCSEEHPEQKTPKPSAPITPRVKTLLPASMLDGIAERLRAISTELVNDPKSPRGWRLFGQVQALIGIMQDKEEYTK